MRPFDARTTSAREADALATLSGLTVVDEPRLSTTLDAAVPALPLKIQVQTSTRCNAACTMCPYPDIAGAPGFAPHLMDDALYARLLEALAGSPVERFSPFLMNEPLLDRRMPRLVQEARAALPATTLGLFTNGSALTPERAVALAGAGLNELCVSVHGFERATYEAVMVGLSFDRVMAQLREICRLHAAGALGGLRLQAIVGDTPELARTPPPDWLAPHVLVKGFSNERVVSEVEAAGSPQRERERPLCQRPFVKLYVLSNGDCVMCNCDWRRRVLLGNLGRASLAEIWRGAAYRALRVRHVRRDFPADHPCHACDYPWVVDE